MNRRDVIGSLAATAGVHTVPGWAADTTLEENARTAWLAVLPTVEMAGARTRFAAEAARTGGSATNALLATTHLVGPETRTVTAPNNDTLYQNGFVNLTRGPATLVIPDAGRRYQSVAILNMQTRIDAVIGARTPGGPAGTWRLLPPGAAPRDRRDIVLSPPHAWVNGRILVTGPDDLAAGLDVQRRVTLSGPVTQPPPPSARRADDWPAFFRSAAALMASDPPPEAAGCENPAARRTSTGRGTPPNRAPR